MVSETELLWPVAECFGNEYLYGIEVPFRDRRIDLVATSKSGMHRNPSSRPEVYAIEAKISKWKRALAQALVYQLCADKAYVAIDHRHVPNGNIIQLFHNFGVGIISVDGEARTIIDARSSAYVNQRYAHEVARCTNLTLSQLRGRI